MEYINKNVYGEFAFSAICFHKEYERTKEAAEKLVEYCIAHNILTQYLNRKKDCHRNNQRRKAGADKKGQRDSTAFVPDGI